MKTKFLVGAMALCAATLMATSAEASVVRFTISGDYSATWDLDSALAPPFYQSGVGTVFWNVAGTFDGAAQPLADLTFYSSSVGGGLNIYDFQGDFNLLAADGPQLYTGIESAPVFKLGTFELTQFRGQGTYTLTVANVAEVPVPATGFLAIVALGLLSVVVRGRKARLPS